jgi:hypothetical protein
LGLAVAVSLSSDPEMGNFILQGIGVCGQGGRLSKVQFAHPLNAGAPSRHRSGGHKLQPLGTELRHANAPTKQRGSALQKSGCPTDVCHETSIDGAVRWWNRGSKPRSYLAIVFYQIPVNPV